MAPNTTLLLCLSLALVSLVQGYPFDIEDGFDQDGDVEEEMMPLVDRDEAVNEVGGAMDFDGMSAQDRLLDFYERDRRGARWNKNFAGVSSLDRSITSYMSFMSCRVGATCKPKFKQTFRCKCNRHTYCVGPGKKYEARCQYSAVGYVFYQP